MTLKLWANILSQPSRTIIYILKKFNIDHEYIHVDIPKETRSEEFRKNVNPAGSVPVIEHDGEKFFESASIIRYLIDTFGKDDTLLPSTDRKARARIEATLDRNGNTLRPSIAGALVELIFKPMFFGAPPPGPEETKVQMDKLNSAFEEINTKLEGHKFLCGDELTIADLQVYNEVLNATAIGRFALDSHPNLQQWKIEVEKDPIVQSINAQVYETLAKIFAATEAAKAKAGTQEEQKKPEEAKTTSVTGTKIPYRTLGNTGLKVSVFTFGTWLTAHDPKEEQNVID